MALSYEDFLKSPIHIIGIDESYNDELTSIEDFVLSEIEYTGDVEDLIPIIPYFVFFKFCDDRSSQVTTSGESYQTAEFTFASLKSQVRAWNTGANFLLSLCTEKVQTANANYQSKITFI